MRLVFEPRSEVENRHREVVEPGVLSNNEVF